MIVKILENKLSECIKSLYGAELTQGQNQIQETKKEFEGDYTVMVFPLVKISKKLPEQTAEEIGHYLLENAAEVIKFNVVKGFLNLSISPEFWLKYLKSEEKNENTGFCASSEQSRVILVEYSSPNTNKPLHLGHIRNNLLGYSVAGILAAAGHKVYKTNIVNDRGIHICKSMLAWQKWGNGANPENTGKKGDHLVGEFYVLFDKEYKKQVAALKASGIEEENAKKEAPLLQEAQEMLRQWENNQPEIRNLWSMMNAWVYKGFDETYRKMGVDFDKIYYESETFMQGKEEILQAVEKNIFQQKEDSSVWVDLTADGLDEKILLRSDGTSVYITQDIGTAILRQQDFAFDDHVYVVGNEQDYHFKVLKVVLQKLGYTWADSIYHLSYGMVELPEGKMKSREGTVVDADNLIDEMVQTATAMSKELGKLDEMTTEESTKTNYMIAMGALKYFILKVDPKKTILFNPKESIDFNGNTGPFIQYTHARIRSLLKKAVEQNINIELDTNTEITEKEKSLIKNIYNFASVIEEAAKRHSPALLANYCYEMAKEYNQFYHDIKILTEENEEKRAFRLVLSEKVAQVLKNAFNLLGIDVPERM